MARICNICKHPRRVTYQERDKETGEIRLKNHVVPCLGHEGIHEALHNLHPNYHKHQRYYAQLRKNNARTTNY